MSAGRPLKLGLLSAPGTMMLGQQIKAILDRGIPISDLILDEKGPAARDLGIHEERTAGRMPDLGIDAFNGDRFRVHRVRNHNDPVVADLVKELGLDVLVNAGTPRILKTPLLRATPIGVLNCHPGLLPMFRGCSCVEWAIHLDQAVGNTIHLMSEGIDEGPVLLREEVEITSDDDYVGVRVKVYQAGHRLMAAALAGLMDGSLDPAGEEQAEGRYFKPMSDELLAEVKEKLRRGAYAGQTAIQRDDGRS